MTDDAAGDPPRSKSDRTSNDPSSSDPVAPSNSSSSSSESDPESEASEDWSPPPCPRCGTPVVMVTTTGPDSHYTSCGCRLTHGEATDLR